MGAEKAVLSTSFCYVPDRWFDVLTHGQSACSQHEDKCQLIQTWHACQMVQKYPLALNNVHWWQVDLNGAASPWTWCTFGCKVQNNFQTWVSLFFLQIYKFDGLSKHPNFNISKP